MSSPVNLILNRTPAGLRSLAARMARAAAGLSEPLAPSAHWPPRWPALWPAHCLVCREACTAGSGAPGDALCPACRGALPWNRSACARCAQPMPLPTEACGHCLRRPPPLHAVHAAFVYGPPLDRLLPRLKFHDDLAAGRLLAALMAEAWAADAASLVDRMADSMADPLTDLTTDRADIAEVPASGFSGGPAPSPETAAQPLFDAGDRRTRPDALIPLPLHPRRLRARGYDQALELARPLAKRFGLPLRTDLLTRVRDTAPQSRLDAPARRKNLRRAFAVRRTGLARTPLKHVVLIDDVMTTGATLHAAAEALLRAGVERVDAWVCARVE